MVPLGPPDSSTQMASRLTEPFFAGLTSVTDRPTDHATRSVTIGCIYACSTAMWPNNDLTIKSHNVITSDVLDDIDISRHKSHC